MKTLKRLAAATALTLVFAFAAFAECEPGQVNTPCVPAQITSEDSVVSETSESSASTASAAVEISETAIDVLLSALSLF